jgi:hypothetical protein
LSHDQGLTWARNTHSSRPQAQPALDRPSLFAGMEPDADDAPDRVRILSTLAASRPPSKRASGRSRRQRGHSWQFKALLALMGLGIVGLLAGFAMVLAQGHSQAGTTVSPEPARSDVVAAPANPAKPHPATASPSASAANVPSTPAPQTAVIEEVAPAAVAGLGKAAAASPLAALDTTPPAPSTPPKSTPAAVTEPKATAPTTASAQDEPRRVAKASPAPAPAEARPRQTATKRGQDADVALLEAMFTHTRAGGTDSERRRRCAQQPQSAGCAASR